jgi:hypothetical protein
MTIKLVNFVTDIDCTFHGLDDKENEIKNINYKKELKNMKINLNLLKYDNTVVENNIQQIANICIFFFSKNDWTNSSKLLRILYHCKRKDINVVHQALAIKGLCELIPERTKETESIGQSPERLAIENRLCKISLIPNKKGVKNKPNYVITTQNSDSVKGR